MANVSIESVGKHYASYHAIKDISIDIPDGEFVVLVGPSGCGKSTLLRMIAGLEDISSGRIRIGERVVNDLPPKDRDIAMVFQSYALYPHMTVRQNMAFSLRLKRVSKEEMDAAIGRAARILGLENLLDRFPKQLSGGQRQRVAMGRAIVRNPQVFLFDEPLSNLDAKLRVQMRAEIKRLHQRLGTTTVYVTHDQIEAMTMADRIVVMREGIVEQVGTPLELYDRPANLFVAGFLGSPAMNFLQGEIGPTGFVLDDGTVLPTGQQNGPAAIYGIRPESLALDPQGIAAEVVLVEPTGAESQVILRLGGQDVVGVFKERVLVQPGDNLSIAINVDGVHLFDRNGRRLPGAYELDHKDRIGG